MRKEGLHLADCAPEELTGVIDSAEMSQRFLPGGELRVDVDRLYLPHAVVQRGRYGMGVLASGAWPAGQVCLGLVLETPSHATVNGFLCPAVSVQLYAEGAEVSYRAPPGSAWFAYCAERERLQESVTALFGRPLPMPRTGALSINPHPALRRRLAACVDALFEVCADPPGAHLERVRALENELLYQAAHAVVPAAKNPPGAARRHAENRRRLMSLAEEYLRANLSQSFVPRDCASAVGCSEQMLARQFRSIYGVTPGAWFRSMKLDAARQDMLRRSGTGVRVSDIAARWGFSHLGRFSVEYRRLFGESPRDTLST